MIKHTLEKVLLGLVLCQISCRTPTENQRGQHGQSKKIQPEIRPEAKNTQSPSEGGSDVKKDPGNQGNQGNQGN
ncbi:MAG: hypothetical protein NTX25_14880, partial [Proteobacteria bacterium]|nr:hypothetical protein [Pseudomonadota bacterium]